MRTAVLLTEQAQEVFLDDGALISRRYLLQDDAGQRVEANVFGRAGEVAHTCAITMRHRDSGEIVSVCMPLDNLRALVAATTEPLTRPSGDGAKARTG